MVFDYGISQTTWITPKRKDIPSHLDEALIIIEELLVLSISDLSKIKSITHDTTDTTETLAELRTLRRLVRDEVQRATELLVVVGQPLNDSLTLNGLVVDDVLVRLSSLRSGNDGLFSTSILATNDVTVLRQVLPNNNLSDGRHLQSSESITKTVANLAAVLGNLFEIAGKELLLTDELDTSKRISSEVNSLSETVLTTVRNIVDTDDDVHETGIKKIRGCELLLEFGGTGEDETSDSGLIVGNEAGNSGFSDLTHVVMTLLKTNTSETKSGLTTTTVLLRKLDVELVKDCTSRTSDLTEESTVTIHDDETEFLIIFKESLESLSVEAVIAHVEGGLERLERLNINRNLLLLTIGSQNFTAVKNETVFRDFVIELQTLLSRGNSRKDGKTVDTRLNVSSGTVFGLEHGSDLRNLGLGRDNQGDNGCTITKKKKESERRVRLRYEIAREKRKYTWFLWFEQ